MAMTLAGAPALWTQPFSPHSTADTHRMVEKPMPRLHNADSRIAAARNMRGLT
jgi:hypothetical protein